MNLHASICLSTLWRPAALLLSVLCAGLAACVNLGPASIQAGRLSYVEAISATNEQQILLAVLRNRYNQHGALLAVNSITANIRIAANSSLQAGFGDSDNYRGNLVPFGAGVQYEENPTISYAPVEGEAYLRRVMVPLPLSRLALLAGNLRHPDYVYQSLIARVNDIGNPGFERGKAPDARFAHFVDLMVRLEDADSLRWLAQSESQADVIIDRSDSESAALAAELLALTGLVDPSPGSSTLVLPVSMSLDGRADNALGITSRSIWGLVEILSAAIEVPPADRLAGITADAPAPAGSMAQLSIKFSDQEPGTAAVAVPYRGGWFYISDRDLYTKQVFRLLSALWGGAIAETSSKITPLMTVPVSR